MTYTPQRRRLAGLGLAMRSIARAANAWSNDQNLWMASAR